MCLPMWVTAVRRPKCRHCYGLVHESAYTDKPTLITVTCDATTGPTSALRHPVAIIASRASVLTRDGSYNIRSTLYGKLILGPSKSFLQTLVLQRSNSCEPLQAPLSRHQNVT